MVTQCHDSSLEAVEHRNMALHECGETLALKSPLSTWEANRKRDKVLYLGESPKLICIGGTLIVRWSPPQPELQEP